MPIGSKKLPVGHSPDYSTRSRYGSNTPKHQQGFSDRGLAEIAAKALNHGWEVNLVEASSPVFVDAYGKELRAPIVVFNGSVGPSECYNFYQVQTSSYLPHEVPLKRVLYLRNYGNDLTPIKLERWEQSMLGLIESFGGSV
jgi:hypothetical protein